MEDIRVLFVNFMGSDLIMMLAHGFLILFRKSSSFFFLSVPRAAPGRARPPAPLSAKGYSTPGFWPLGAEERKSSFIPLSFYKEWLLVLLINDFFIEVTLVNNKFQVYHIITQYLYALLFAYQQKSIH